MNENGDHDDQINHFGQQFLGKKNHDQLKRELKTNSIDHFHVHGRRFVCVSAKEKSQDEKLRRITAPANNNRQKK